LDQATSRLITDKARRTAEKYRGGVAAGYEAKRTSQVKWQAEQRLVERWLSEVAEEAGEDRVRVLDIPVGTGRFLPTYQRYAFDVTGIDVSDDMLAIARAKVAPSDVPVSVTLELGSIFDIVMPDAAVDIAVCIRIVNLIGESDMQIALRELQRVTRSQILFNVREGEKGKSRYRNPQSIKAIKAALQPGWRIASNVEIHEPDFRMIRLERDPS
jgi:ubiquinone/menaquinone biosynthesis C-methylase UbiE